MNDIAYLADHQAVNRIVDYLKFAFAAEKVPQSHVFEQISFLADEESRMYF
jgi:hypothetical protein